MLAFSTYVYILSYTKLFYVDGFSLTLSHVGKLRSRPLRFKSCLVSSQFGWRWQYQYRYHLVGGLNPSEKYEFVSWDDEIPT